MSRPERWLFHSTLLLALGAGILSLILFWFALLGIDWSVIGVTALWFTCMIGVVVILRPHLREGDRSRPSTVTQIEWIGVGIIIAIAAAILFNGAYFPFSRDDTLGIYKPTALTMWETGTLVPLTGADSLYRTYPILVPLNYTFAYLVSGWENEYLAKSIATLLSLGCLPAVYFIGRDIGSRRLGLLAALILALTPSFVRWGSSGYVDLPMAFYYTLGALFARRFYRDGRIVDAALAGVMIGFAAITKNAGLIGVPLLVGWFGLITLQTARIQRINRKLASGQTTNLAYGPFLFSQNPSLSPSVSLCITASIVSLALTTLIAAPWYIRNLIGAGFLIPDTAWTDQAERSLQNLAIFVTLPDNFALSGWLVMGGVLFSIWRILKRRHLTDIEGLFLWFTLPFFAAWWLFVSYDPRFLLLFYPILCVGAAFCVLILVHVWQHHKPIPRLTYIAAALVVSAMALYCLWIAVEFKRDILRNPLMPHEEKVALVRGDR